MNQHLENVLNGLMRIRFCRLMWFIKLWENEWRACLQDVNFREILRMVLPTVFEDAVYQNV